MYALPMSLPAEIRRARGDSEIEVVARGPLVMMAYGLLAIDESEGGACWISSDGNRLDTRQAREVLRRWNTRH